MGFRGYAPYQTIEELRYKNVRKKVAYLKKHPDAKPVVLQGSLGKTWWGKAWNQNLERYADYENRLGRGKRYIKGEAIFDLKIKKGNIHAIVAGSGRIPYTVSIDIDPMSAKEWKTLQKECGDQIESMEVLLQGKFPKGLKEAFFLKDHGLFPSPKQIHIHCDCPDYAVLCKHAAAVLYAVSIQLDEDPSLFFQLRQINMDDLIKKALGENVNQLIDNAKKKSSRILEEDDLETLFHLV